ncbi:cupin domain-containing protein [Limibaculum sp. M0105]|uniref:Cupin domain-containing protein n=1 Tax=Thermohalobaculum xanthum TaxID=2753746 RepID=A0A8J7M7W2_9RHOB|nr:cupin domain-containing protein [Thermohalobaculum xanthum]MBK0399923.1 cupin domain-containing protein [Thermohalobaculum xanthum]
MEIMQAGARPTRRASAEYFTGTVWQDPVIDAPDPARVMALRVAFEPGARTHWHTHPLGQTLHVLSGVGRVQAEGGPVVEIRPGDTVWIPPGKRHWHGAAPDCAMVHLAIQEREGARAVDWFEPVSEADYARAPGGMPG